MRRNRLSRLGIEALEGRSLMAGDVFAAVEGSLLLVEGDNLDNQVTIAQTAAGDVVVSGQNGTTINGLPSVRFVRPALNAAEVRMGSGNDTLVLRGVQLTNDLFVDLGAGNDRLTTVAAAPVTVGANASIYGESGNDTVVLNSLTVREDLFIDGGIGRDVVNITDAAVVEDIGIFTGAGDDVVRMTNTSSNKVTVSLDEGSDRLEANNVAAATDIIFEGGAGVDTLLAVDVLAGIFRDYKEFERFL